MPKFKVWQSEEDGLFYWHVVSENGKVVADGSEGYVAHTDCLAGAREAKQGLDDGFAITVSEKVNEETL